jgi:hypothetical protein
MSTAFPWNFRGIAFNIDSNHPCILCLFQQIPDLLELAAELPDDFMAEGGGGVGTVGFFLQIPSSTFDCKFLIIKQILDFKNEFHITSAVHSLAGFGAAGFDAVKFSLPEAQDCRRYPGDTTDLTDAVKEFVRNLRLVRWLGNHGKRSFPVLAMVCMNCTGTTTRENGP